MALTDDELLELAKQDLDSDEDSHDIWYYQQQYSIVDGLDSIYTNHLFYNYKNWSLDPVCFDIFLDCLKLNNKNKKHVFIDKNKCTINLEKLIGDYVKKQRKIQKEERFRKISSSKS